ncbi:pseudouridylate synthase RPUSD2 [Synchiropus picturatus]
MHVSSSRCCAAHVLASSLAADFRRPPGTVGVFLHSSTARKRVNTASSCRQIQSVHGDSPRTRDCSGALVNFRRLFTTCVGNVRCLRSRMEAARAPADADASEKAVETGKRKSDEASLPAARGKRRRGAGGKNLRPGERYVPPPQKRNPGVSFSPEDFNETSYYFEGGLRKVRPYYFAFKTYCKGRWVGKSLLDVFRTEFRCESLDYYQRAVKEGRIRLNGDAVEDLSVVLKNNDLMKNTVHRHEPPVVGSPLRILVDDGEVLVLDKPASIPVHPCGRFRHNSVIFILGKEHGISALHTVHRLDRLTSGVLLFARTLEKSKVLDQLVRDRKLEKEYVCRVDGEFPDGELICEEPILVVSFKIGLCRVDAKGKECRTVFNRISFNGKSSVVRCLPLTGRTHQIRVHLQYLGFPIVNDPIYGSSAWGPHRGKGGQVGKSDEELYQALVQEHKAKEGLDLEGDDIGIPLEGAGEVAAAEKTLDQESGDSQTEATGSTSNGAQCDTSETAGRDHLCSECKLVRPDPTEAELVMYLHALRYKGPDFEYSTDLPDWAKEDWDEV